MGRDESLPSRAEHALASFPLRIRKVYQSGIMTGPTQQIRLRLALATGAAAILALPAQASAPEAEYVSAPVVQEIEPDVASTFERFDELPDAPEPTGNVVDLATIEPPIELPPPEPEPEPEPALSTKNATKNGRSLGTGIASYYGRRFHGRLTANGERFNMNAMTAAHKTLRFGSKVRVTNPRNGRSVVVRINDRGPFTPGRTIDLSKAAAQRIGLIKRGHGRVKLELL